MKLTPSELGKKSAEARRKTMGDEMFRDRMRSIAFMVKDRSRAGRRKRLDTPPTVSDT